MMWPLAGSAGFPYEDQREALERSTVPAAAAATWMLASFLERLSPAGKVLATLHASPRRRTILFLVYAVLRHSQQSLEAVLGHGSFHQSRYLVGVGSGEYSGLVQSVVQAA